MKMTGIATCIVAMFICCCSGMTQSQENPRLRMVITGNTCPESPFSGFTEKFPDLIRAINIENPVIVIHTGNMVHGGQSWMGINQKDLTRQYDILYSAIHGLSSIVYTLSGDKDLYDKSASLYIKYSQKDVAYSFNYGGIHIVMIPLVEIAERTVKEQVAWLALDLSKFNSSQCMFVITHMPVFCDGCAHLPTEEAEAVHSMLKKYPVKAVFSGGANKLYEKEKDGIRYIVAGCGGFVSEEKHRNYNQFYLIRYDGQDITIEGKKL